jgi:hypothetical protein
LNKSVLKSIRNLSLGDLVKIEWFDASIGKSLSGGLNGIDVPVVSWGVFLGVLGSKNRHIILAQNSFRYADGVYDIDYTAVPLAWTANATVIAKAHVPIEEAKQLLNSFLVGGKRASVQGKKQQKMRNHG